MKKIAIVISALLVIGALGMFASACGGGGNNLQATTASGAPAWVLKGSGAFTGDRGKAFYGVGSAPKMVDISMARDRANNRARRQILQIFNTYIAYMMKDYSRSTTAGDMSKESYEADVMQVQKTISIGDINGAQIVDNWKDPSDGTIYSLAVLDLAAMADILANKGELDAKLRDYVRANAAKGFDDLEKEEAKRAGGAQ
jgi:hypothetical protein